MILVDTSVWIEYLRNGDQPTVARLEALINANEDLRITEPIVMELLAGADTPLRDSRISQLVNGLPLLPLNPALDYRAAAQLYVLSRKNGHPIRSLNDCLIAAVVVRSGAHLLHRDRDFEFLAEITPLSFLQD
ncbi:PIN domain nuclease [Leucobacter denitrificans]|uniref:Ribonuclease VapC n=1 Tax=Leucobacter denitrificans TaxID=683042 RepID=A0A7G9S2D9_9MICO|nr:PIN domain nuclease [Leucobacter denitrificans]QNN62014.1 PIN domain nuclease [Leucobacter denitrificans]